MPTRNLVYEALALRARESPGGSQILTLMTAESGLVDVFVFGGPKSKLRSLAAPYAAGRAFVYLDPVKDFQKLSDFEVRDSFPALREDLDRLWSAGLVAELLIKTSGGGGDYPLVLDLALACLGALDRYGQGPSPKGSRIEGPILVFIWRLVSLLGVGPDPSSCSLCGTELKPSSGGAYSFVREGFLCPACASREAGASLGAGDSPGAGDSEASRFVGTKGRILRLGPDALRWLMGASALPFGEAAQLGIPSENLDSIKALVFGLAREAAQAPLASFAHGAGML